MNQPVVMKFGGTSVQDAAALRRVVAAVGVESRPRVVVVSALAGVTDALSDIADGRVKGAAAGEAMHRVLERHVAIVRELVALPSQDALLTRLRKRLVAAADAAAARTPGQEQAARDAVLAVGELASSEVFAAVLAAAGVPSVWVDARDVVRTDNTFGRARPDTSAMRGAAATHLLPRLSAGAVPVMGGYIGSAPGGETTTLGRGGSDYSAALVAAAIGARELQIWTDVDGVFTSDPRVIADATRIPRLSYGEAHQLARFGAKVLHWGTIEPSREHDIPVRVLSSQSAGPGTVIDGQSHGTAPAVAGLTHRLGVTIADIRSRRGIDAPAFVQDVFCWLERTGVAATVLSVSMRRVVVVIHDTDLSPSIAAGLQNFAEAYLLRNVALVAVVGEGVVGQADVLALLAAAGEAGHLHEIVPSYTGDALVCVTGRSVALRLLASLHEAFFAAPADRRRPAARPTAPPRRVTSAFLPGGAL